MSPASSRLRSWQADSISISSFFLKYTTRTIRNYFLKTQAFSPQNIGQEGQAPSLL